MLPLSWEWKKLRNVLQSGLGHSLPPPLSLSGTQPALHMSSGWRLTGFAGHSKKLQRGCIGGFLKAVVVVPKQLGPARRSFHLESWADPFRALRMNHLLPALPGKGRDSQDWAGVIQDGRWHLEGGLSLRVVVRGSESGSGVKSPAGGTARLLALPRLKHIWSPRLGTSNIPCVDLPTRTTLEIGRIQCRCPVFTRVETDEWSESKFECGSAT